MDMARAVMKMAHTLRSAKQTLTRELLRDAFRVSRRNDLDEFWGFLLQRDYLSLGAGFEEHKVSYQQLQQALRDYQTPACLIAQPRGLWSECDKLCCELNERIHRIYGYRRNDLFSIFKRFASPDGVTSVSISQGVFRDACLSELRMKVKAISANAFFEVLGELNEGDDVGVSLYDISCVLKHKFDIDSNHRQLDQMVKKNVEMNKPPKRKPRSSHKKGFQTPKDSNDEYEDEDEESEEELSLVDRLLLGTGSVLVKKKMASPNIQPPPSRRREKQEVVVLQQEVFTFTLFATLTIYILFPVFFNLSTNINIVIKYLLGEY